MKRTIMKKLSRVPTVNKKMMMPLKAKAFPGSRATKQVKRGK